MARVASDIAFTPIVKSLQARKGSRRAYAHMEANGSWRTDITPELEAFIAAQRSVFLATVNGEGQPYIQHRGGPPGFLRALDPRTLAFVDFSGNRQYITSGNLLENPKAHLFLIDYRQRKRVKIWGEARMVEADDAWLSRLMPEGYKARPEQVLLCDHPGQHPAQAEVAGGPAADHRAGDAEHDGEDPAHRIRTGLDQPGQDADDEAAEDVTEDSTEHVASRSVVGMTRGILAAGCARQQQPWSPCTCPCRAGSGCAGTRWEFVPVRVGMRAQHAGDHELRAGEFLAEHAHERDGAAFAHVHRRLAEEVLAGLVDRVLQPRRQRRRIPAGARLLQVQADLCAVRRILQQFPAAVRRRACRPAWAAGAGSA
jgi:predicted pyridoxine 5'-phosphate oxidase superfamily flavin-nucleotide-binding protein